MGRSVIRELVAKSPKVIPSFEAGSSETPAGEWQTHYVFFARAGFSDATMVEAEAIGATLVDLETLDADLTRALAGS